MILGASHAPVKNRWLGQFTIEWSLVSRSRGLRVWAKPIPDFRVSSRDIASDLGKARFRFLIGQIHRRELG